MTWGSPGGPLNGLLLYCADWGPYPAMFRDMPYEYSSVCVSAGKQGEEMREGVDRDPDELSSEP